MGSLFSGSKQPGASESKNVNKDLINSTFTGPAGYTAGGGDLMSQLLGIGKSGAEAYGDYKKNAGYDFTMDQGQRGIVGGQAARGLLNSGSTSKALVRYGEGVSQQYYKDYLDKLLGFSNLGLGAGALLSDAGKTSNQQSSTGKPGLGDIGLSLASTII